ncbi:MAG: MBL fold metallo-hydrolase [Bacteroidota bacterium]
MKRTLKLLLAILSGVIILITLAITIFMYTSPQFGQKPKGKDLERIKKSQNYNKKEFVNLIETKMGSFGEMMSTLPDFLFAKNTSPTKLLPVKFNQAKYNNTDSLCYITWYGHSAFLMEMEGKRILIDPMLGNIASPVSFGTKRFSYEKAIPLDELKDIDAVILSHDHYDHLDYPTIKKIKDEVGHFYTALGVGSHLKSWGVPSEKITELDWWEKSELGNIQLVATPARHFSGRGITDRNSTQWASWVIQGKNQNLYFSGDGGYGPHFKEIGEQYGPFDLAMMECGQYNKAWEAIHMMPEQSVQAGIDVKGKLLMPIHWGAFKLSIHEWTDPIDRFKRAGLESNISIIHPYIGERFQLGKDLPQENWWQL